MQHIFNSKTKDKNINLKSKILKSWIKKLINNKVVRGISNWKEAEGITRCKNDAISQSLSFVEPLDLLPNLS